VSASNLDNDYINEENSPIPIPPAKHGWADMERRLNATPPKIRMPLFQKAAAIAGIVVVSGIAFAIAYHTIYRSRIHHPPVHTSEQPATSADHPSTGTLAGEKILSADSLQHRYFSLNKYLPAGAGITDATERHGTTLFPVAIDTAKGAPINPSAPAPTNAPVNNSGTGANSPTIPHNGGAAKNISHRNRSRKAVTHPARQEPGVSTTANVQAATKKTTPVTMTNPRAYNVSSAATTAATSPEKNITAAPATLPSKTDISFSSRLQLQSLPLSRMNRSALAQRLPAGVTLPTHKIRQRNLPEWQLWLQWQVSAPLSGSTYYLSGPDGNNQLYRLLAPGIRAVRKWNARAVSLDLTPFTAQTYNDPKMRESSHRNADSTTTREQLTLHKEFGASGAILYHHRMFNQWQVAAGVQLNYWLTRSGDLQTTHYPPWGGSATDSGRANVKESIQWVQWKVPLEVYYDARRWQAGLRVDVPLNINRSDSSTARIKTPVQLQLMLRYKLLPRRK
jgi:hypothetical protein